MKQKNKINKVKIIVIITCITILSFTSYSIGKQITEVVISMNAQIAKPILIVDYQPEIEITESKKEGEYYFKVKNYEAEEISQVDMQYYVEIIGRMDNAINCTLYKDNKEIELKNNRTQNQSIQKEQKQEDSYCLKVKYDNTKTAFIEDIMQELQIKVHSEQIRY